MLRKLRLVWFAAATLFNSVMLWVAALVSSFCRSEEVTTEDEDKYDPKTHLSFADVPVDNAVMPAISDLCKYQVFQN